MGCGSSTHPVAKEVGEDPNQTENCKERLQEKHVSSKPHEKVEDNVTFNQTEDVKSGYLCEKEKEDKGKVPAARDVSAEAINVSSTHEQVQESTACEGSCNIRDQSNEIVMEVRDVANVENNSRESLHGKDGNSVMAEVHLETTIPGRTEDVIQATAGLSSSSEELVEKETCKINENPVEKDVQIDKEITSPTEGKDTVIIQNENRDKQITSPTEGRDGVNIQNESRDLVNEEGVGIPGETETVIQVTAEFSNGELGETEKSGVENPQEEHNHIDTDITSLTEIISNRPSPLETELQNFVNSPLNANGDSSQDPSCANSDPPLNKESEIAAVQDHGQVSQTNCVASFPAVKNQSNSSLVQGKEPDEIVLEQTSIENIPEKESETSVSVHVHENTFAETSTLPGSEHKISSDSIVVESSSTDDQNKNSETALLVSEQEATNNYLSTVNEECTTVANPCGDERKEEANRLLLQDSSVDVVTAQSLSNETANLESANVDISSGKEILPLRDTDAENRMITALRLSCKLSPGNPVEDLDTSGVLSLHLMRSLSPGEITVAELVRKLDNLTELDLSGNLLGPQGFRVICLALSRNTTMRMLNLANNLAGTDSSECIGMMLSTNCFLEKLDVSGNNLGNDYFSRCVGPALRTNKSLKALKFSSCGSTDASAICEALVEGNATLEELDASNNHFGAVFGDGLSSVLQKPSCSLRHLDIHGTHLEKEGMAALLEGIRHNNSLVSLNAAGHQVSSLSFLMDFLYSCICHSTMEELILDGSKVLEHNEWEPPDAPAPEGSSSLTKLLLSGCSLTNKALQTLAGKIPGKLVHLIYLDLSSNEQLTAECLSCISAVCSCPGQTCSLSGLDFSLNAADGIAVEMEKLPELKNLNTLLLKKCRIISPSVADLSSFIAVGTPDSLHISSLTLDGIKFSGTDALKGMLGLSDLFIPTNPCGLELLSLTGCGLNDKDVKPLLSAMGNGLVIKELRLSANRLTDTAVNYLVDSTNPLLSLQVLDLSINKIRNGGAEKLAEAMSDKLTNIKSLSLADNCIGKTGILALVCKISPVSQLGVLNLKSQQQPLGEEDMDQIMEELAKTLGFNLESNGEHATARCNLPPNLSINLTGLGGEPGELGPKLDSLAIMTDYSSKHRRTLTLEDALQLSAVLSRSANTRAQMSQRDWNLVISADKDAPAWLQLPSERESAIYVSNLPLSVTAEKLEGLLDSEAECNVKEVYLLKDQILRKPNGLAWVLFTDTASVQRAVEYYNSGHAFMYGTPFVICAVVVAVIVEGDTEETAEARARQEIIQRAEDRKADQTAHAQLVQSNYKESLARHEYAAQHPAYADGRVW